MEHLLTSIYALWSAAPVGQACGLIATAFYLYSALQRSDRKLQGLMLVGTVFWVLHYGLLHAWVAALSYVVGIARNGLLYFGYVLPHRRIPITLGFIAAYSAVGIITVRTPIEIIPCICSMLYAVALFNMSGIRMRVVMMSAQFSWFFYALHIGSIGGSIVSGSEFILTVVTVTRLLRIGTIERETAAS